MSGVCRRRRNTSKAQGKSGRDEINRYPICHLPRAAKTTVTLRSVHRKPLMPQRFSYARIHMRTKIGNRRPRRHRQHQRHHPGNHPGKHLRLRTHSPADREIEHHLRTLTAPPPHQQRARRGNHRMPTHPQRLRQLFDPAGNRRVKLDRRRRPIRIPLTRSFGQPINRATLRRKIPSPISLIVQIIGGRLVLQLTINQILQRTKKRRRNRCARNQCRIDSRDPTAYQRHAQSVGDYVMAARE